MLYLLEFIQKGFKKWKYWQIVNLSGTNGATVTPDYIKHVAIVINIPVAMFKNS